MNAYEHLENSIKVVEENTPRLMKEMNANGKKFLNLSNVIDQLDTKCENLQTAINEMTMEQEGESIKMRKAFRATESLIRRPMYYESNSWENSGMQKQMISNVKLSDRAFESNGESTPSLTRKKESLTPMGQIVDWERSIATSQISGIQEPNHKSSLLDQLCDQYRILIEMYKTLIGEKEKQCEPQALISSCLDNTPELSLSQNMVGRTRDLNSPQPCQRCLTCSCNFNSLAGSVAKSKNTKELPEIGATPERKIWRCCKFTQTEGFENKSNDVQLTQASSLTTKNLTTSILNPSAKPVQDQPNYKQLFVEISEVLKKRIDRKSDSRFH